MALPNDMQRITEGLAKLEASNPNYSADENKKKAARNIIRPIVVLVKPAADAMAGDATAYTAAYQVRAPRAGRLVGAAIQPQGTATADATNNATLNAVKGDGAAGAAVVLASYTSNVAGGSLAAGVTKALTLSAVDGALNFVKGAVLSFNITKAGTGVALPILTVSLDIEWEGVDDYPV